MKKYMKFALIGMICFSLFLSGSIAVGQGTNKTVSVETRQANSSTFMEPAQFENGVNYSRPFLDKVTYQINDSSSEVDALVLRERNDSKGEGYIAQIEQYTNVTIYYKVLNGTSNSEVFLHTDVPSLDSDLDINNQSVSTMTYVSSTDVTFFKLPYSGEEVNGTLSTYKITFNATSAFITFYARIGIQAEIGENGPRNLLTLGQSYSVNFTEPFYIQNENVTVNLQGENYTGSEEFGIKYRTNYDSLYKYENFTLVVSGSSVNGSINLETFEPGTTIYIESMGYFYDALRDENVAVTAIDVKSVEVGDGTPQLDLEITKLNTTSPEKFRRINDTIYTQSREIFLNFTTTVAKGNVINYAVNYSSFDDFNYTDNLPFTDINGTHYINYTFSVDTDGVWNFTVFAFTDKDLSVNKTFTIYIDQTAPTGSFTSPAKGTTITTDSLTVEFTFNFNDTLSGVRLASLDMDDGTTIEVTGMTNLTYTYKEEGLYSIKLTVIDNAGNVNEDTYLVITVQTEKLTVESAPLSMPFVLVALVAIPLIAKKRRS